MKKFVCYIIAIAITISPIVTFADDNLTDMGIWWKENKPISTYNPNEDDSFIPHGDLPTINLMGIN